MRIAMIVVASVALSGCTATLAESPCENISAHLDNPLLSRWLTVFSKKSKPEFLVLETRALQDTLVYPYLEIDDLSGMVANVSRTAFLKPEIPIRDNEEHELESPDSFADLYDSQQKKLYRIVSVGSGGLIHDAFWLTDDTYLVVGNSEGKPFLTVGGLSANAIIATCTISPEDIKDSPDLRDYLSSQKPY